MEKNFNKGSQLSTNVYDLLKQALKNVTLLAKDCDNSLMERDNTSINVL